MDFFDELLNVDKKASTAPGIVSGIVLENNDKQYPGMVKVEYSVGEAGKNKSGWIPVASYYAGKEYGSYFLPEIGSEVLIAFILGNWDEPVVIGSLWNKQSPIQKDIPHEKNIYKTIKTKGGNKILFSDEDKKQSIEISTPNGMKICINDEKNNEEKSINSAIDNLTRKFKKILNTEVIEKEITIIDGMIKSLDVEKEEATLIGKLELEEKDFLEEITQKNEREVKKIQNWIKDGHEYHK